MQRGSGQNHRVAECSLACVGVGLFGRRREIAGMALKEPRDMRAGPLLAREVVFESRWSVDTRNHHGRPWRNLLSHYRCS